jgi:hypothetical protein
MGDCEIPYQKDVAVSIMSKIPINENYSKDIYCTVFHIYSAGSLLYPMDI